MIQVPGINCPECCKPLDLGIAGVQHAVGIHKEAVEDFACSAQCGWPDDHDAADTSWDVIMQILTEFYLHVRDEDLAALEARVEQRMQAACAHISAEPRMRMFCVDCGALVVAP